MEEIKYGPFVLTPNDTEDGYVISECAGALGSAVIPAEVGGYPITAIGEEAFINHAELREIHFLPRGGQSIEICDHAFDGCVSLRELDLPREVFAVGYGAFRACTSLTKATLGFDSFVGGYAFSGCTSLAEVTPLSYISEGVFENCTSLVTAPISDKVTSIAEGAFEGCTSLTEVRIPAAVTEIEGMAFRSCTALKSVVFEETAGWKQSCCYGDDITINVSDPRRNAARLSAMDFDDGITLWFRE